MLKKNLLITCTVLLISGAAQAQDAGVEARLAALELRLKTTEERAVTAENEVRQLKRQVGTMQPQAEPVTQSQSPAGAIAQPVASTQSAPAAPTLTLNDYGTLKLYGDVEFNADAASRSGQLTSIRTTSENRNWRPGSAERWDVNGRILMGLDGYRCQDSGRYAGFLVQPLANMTGRMGVDDAAFFFGQEQNWQTKIGRFESYDMFPLNQDTFIEYSGNTANDLYADGYGYIYMMKEGRGRSSSGGNIMLSRYLGDWYMEVNTLFEDGTSLYSGNEYHGYMLENKKSTIYVRPVVAWKGENLSAAVAMESNVVRNAYGYNSETNGEWRDQSRRTGYGATFGWNTLAPDPANSVQFNLNTAYLDATDEQDMTIGTNALWHDFEVGYIFAHNNIKAFNLSRTDISFSDSQAETGKYDIHTLHASYRLPNIFDMNNFDLYMGAYTSWLRKDNNNQLASGNDDARYGLRARFKYFF